MEIRLKRESVSYAKNVLSSAVQQEETMEMIVPDALPDILRIADSNAVVFLRSKEADGGRIKISGIIAATVLYVADELAVVKKLTCDIPFSVSAQADEINTQTKMIADISVSSVDTTIINSRKIHVKAEIAGTISCFNDTAAMISADIENADDAELLVLPAISNVLLPTAVKEKTFVISNDLKISAANPPIADMLRAYTEITVDDSKAVGNKLVVRCTSKTHVLYRGAGGGTIITECFDNEFSQIVEMDVLSDSSSFKIVPMLTSEYYDTDMMTGEQEGRTVVTEVHAVLQCIAIEKIEMTYLSDAYSTKFRINEQRDNILFITQVDSFTRSSVLKCTVEVAPKPERVIAVNAYSGLIRQKSENDTIQLMSMINVQIIYLSEDGGVYSAVQRLESNAGFERNKNWTYNARVKIKDDIFAMSAAGVIELRIPVEYIIDVHAQTKMSALTSISISDDDLIDMSEVPTIIVRAVNENDTLWSLAKEYSSTPAAILEVNKLEPGTAIKSRKLLIAPKKR